MEMFQHTSDISSHNTRASNKALLIPLSISIFFSLRYKDHPSISDIHTMYAIKKKLNSIYDEIWKLSRQIRIKEPILRSHSNEFTCLIGTLK